MNIAIRTPKRQEQPMTDNQLKYACKCVQQYKELNHKTYFTYTGSIDNEKMGCDIYMTKTQISAIVYKN